MTTARNTAAAGAAFWIGDGIGTVNIIHRMHSLTSQRKTHGG